MGNYTILIWGGSKILGEADKQKNLTTNVPKTLDLKSSSEQIFSKNCRWMPLYLVKAGWVRISFLHFQCVSGNAVCWPLRL